MRRLIAILGAAAALGGCLTPSAYHQAHGLVGRPIADAVARYGPPDQPLSEGARAYSWSGGRLTGICKLSVKTDAAGRIADASVVALGFDTCNHVLRADRGG